jgi:diguanylate cyclase (GGDEF)-like protein
MKLRNKSLIIIALTWSLFSVFLYLLPYQLHIVKLGLLTLTFAVMNFAALYYFVISRIEKVNQAPNQLMKPIRGYDEAAQLFNKIKGLCQTIKESNEMLDTRVDEQTKHLQQINFRLHQEISEFSSRKENATPLGFTQTTDRFDAVTTLPNHIYFHDALNKAINSARRRNQLLAILTININQFREVNNSLGLIKSNEVLREVGKRFTQVLRTEDIVAKLDGDEFIVLLTDIGQAKFAGKVAEKLLRACHQKLKFDKNELELTASIGISLYPNDGESLEELIKAADNALYTAKHTQDMGFGNYHFCAKEINVEAREYNVLEKALRNAIENRELMLYYQPKYSIKHGHIAGVETLIRWEHPELGLISPAKFIPIAEESGLIIQIGEWILREACAMNKHWQDAGFEHFTIAVNLSPKQFNSLNFDQTVLHILQETDLNPSYLELEITEKTAMNNTALTERILSALKATGVQLSIDHFGTGHTSITHLKKFPISAVKIDQSFIKGVPNNPNDSAITSAFIGLAHSLGLEVVAEGVETPEQMQYLASLGCDMVQGYYLSHPVPAQKVELQFNKLGSEIPL